MITDELKCLSCGGVVVPVIPSTTGDTTERVYCEHCRAIYYVITGNTGTTINPNHYLVRMV
jgi:hypothetical protein